MELGEKFRLEFIEKRDGKAAAVKFAQQTIDLYTEAAIFRAGMKETIQFLKEYVEKALTGPNE